MKLAITIVATTNYMYAMRDQAHRVQACCQYANIVDPKIIIVSNDEVATHLIGELYRELLPACEFFPVIGTYKESQNYKEDCQIVIGRMRTQAFAKARSLDVDFCLSLDSDVLPAVNGIKTCLQTLEFDNGYYSIASMLYTSQGGGAWLCGRGNPQRPIFPNFYQDELNIPSHYAKLWKQYEKMIKACKDQKTWETVNKKLNWLAKRIEKQFPPKGNVHTMNGIKWRRRGWFDFAYPGIGKGAIVPSDWCGFGATMLTRKALALTDFQGYDGRGTEDLYVIFYKWYQSHLRIAAISHSICDHICRKKDGSGGYFMVQGFFDISEDFEGHLRQKHIDYKPMA